MISLFEMSYLISKHMYVKTEVSYLKVKEIKNKILNISYTRIF